jgi:hypothetical protein
VPAAREEWIRRVGPEISGQTALREAMRKALEELERAVGKLGVVDIHWLVMAAHARARYEFPDGSTWPPNPEWASEEVARIAGQRLVVLLESLDATLKRHGELPPGPTATADLVALALLLHLDHIDWNDPDLVNEVLYVGGVGSVRVDGSGTTVDAAYVTVAQDRALSGLRRDRAPKVRKAYEREGKYDAYLWPRFAQEADPNAISLEALLNDLMLAADEFDDPDATPDPDLSTVRRSLKRWQQRGATAL